MEELKKITFLLPTCEPDEMFKHLLPSIHFLSHIKDKINFAICFQPPYTLDEIKQVLQELDKNQFTYKFFFKDYKVVKPFTPLIQMRNECALLYPDSELYALLDDDMSFENAQISNFYNMVIERFMTDDKLAVIALNPRQTLIENPFATNAGIIYRGGKYYGFKGLMPEKLSQFKGYQTTVPYEGENLLTLYGGFQDKFCAMVRLCNGDKWYEIGYTPVKHVENRKVRGAKGHGWEEAQYEEGSICHFIEKYFNKYFLLTNSLTLFESDLMERIHPDYYNNADTYLVYK